MNPNLALIAFALLCRVNRCSSNSFTVALLGEGATLPGLSGCENGAKTTLVHRSLGDSPTLVARLTGGTWMPEREYADRIAPNSSVVFKYTTFNDDGVYEVTCDAHDAVSLHQLMVVPPSGASVPAGQSVKLPCHLVTAGPAAGVIRWERRGELVFELNLSSGETRHGPGFEGRVSMDDYKHGDASLEVLRAKPEDQGAFLCYRVEGLQRDWGTPAAVRLTVSSDPAPASITTPISTSITVQSPAWITIAALSLMLNGACILYFVYRWYKFKKHLELKQEDLA